MSSIWEDVRGSVFKFCNDFSVEMHNADFADMQLYDWDSYIENSVIPESDLIGPWQLSCDVDFKMITIRGMIGVSVFDDKNLFRLNKTSGILLERLVPDKIINMYGAESGFLVGHMKVAEGSSLSPVSQAQQRSLKFISFVLKADRTFS